MLYSYLLGLFLLLNPKEINIANSLDWMIAGSEIAAVVQIGSCTDISASSDQYEISCLLKDVDKHVEMIKGKKEDLLNQAVYSRLSYIGGKRLKELNGKEVLIFLKKNNGGDPYIWDDDEGLIVLASAGSPAFTGDFKVLDNKTAIIDYVKEKEKLLRDKKAEPRFLEVPFETPAFRALFQGSSCYLVVPDILYPKAKKSM